jgi:type IV secretory pathway VirB3-like protein
MTTRRGTLLEINPALNKPTTKFGVDYRFLAACFFISVVVFLFGSKLFACLMLPSLIAAGALLTRRDPQMFRLWLLSFKLASYYDPGK